MNIFVIRKICCTKNAFISFLVTFHIFSIIQILDNGQMYRLVPSLEGGLFLVDSTAMRPLPITADSLLASSFQLADNSLLVGAQENDLIAVDPETGKVRKKRPFFCSN